VLGVPPGARHPVCRRGIIVGLVTGEKASHNVAVEIHCKFITWPRRPGCRMDRWKVAVHDNAPRGLPRGAFLFAGMNRQHIP
jgi:hypothetical protein